MDNCSKEIRSYNMSKIRCTDTKPEMIFCQYLFAAGFRYRKDVKTLPGCPDIVLPKYKTVNLLMATSSTCMRDVTICLASIKSGILGEKAEWK